MQGGRKSCNFLKKYIAILRKRLKIDGYMLRLISIESSFHLPRLSQGRTQGDQNVPQNVRSPLSPCRIAEADARSVGDSHPSFLMNFDIAFEMMSSTSSPIPFYHFL